MPNQPSEAICTLSRILGGTLRSGSIIWDRTTSGATRFTCGKSASSISGRHRTMLPPCVFLCEDAEAPFGERGFALPARGEAQTAPADHPEPGRGRTADRLIQKSLPLRHASDDVLDGVASK